MRYVGSRCQPRNSATGSTDFITDRLQQGTLAVDGLAVVFHIFPKISVLRLAPDGGGYVFLQIVMSPPSQGSQAGIVRQLLRVFTIFLLLDKPFHSAV